MFPPIPETRNIEKYERKIFPKADQTSNYPLILRIIVRSNGQCPRIGTFMLILFFGKENFLSHMETR